MGWLDRRRSLLRRRYINHSCNVLILTAHIHFASDRPQIRLRSRAKGAFQIPHCQVVEVVLGRGVGPMAAFEN